MESISSSALPQVGLGMWKKKGMQKRGERLQLRSDWLCSSNIYVSLAGGCTLLLTDGLL